MSQKVTLSLKKKLTSLLGRRAHTFIQKLDLFSIYEKKHTYMYSLLWNFLSQTFFFLSFNFCNMISSRVYSLSVYCKNRHISLKVNYYSKNKIKFPIFFAFFAILSKKEHDIRWFHKAEATWA